MYIFISCIDPTHFELMGCSNVEFFAIKIFHGHFVFGAKRVVQKSFANSALPHAGVTEYNQSRSLRVSHDGFELELDYFMVKKTSRTELKQSKNLNYLDYQKYNDYLRWRAERKIIERQIFWQTNNPPYSTTKNWAHS